MTSNPFNNLPQQTAPNTPTPTKQQPLFRQTLGNIESGLPLKDQLYVYGWTKV